MKHIKTPVSVAGYDIGSVYEANGSELCCCYGMVEDQRNKSAEIAMALNEHDRLVAERDALHEAAKAQVRWSESDDDEYVDELIQVTRAARAAISLVRVDDER